MFKACLNTDLVEYHPSHPYYHMHCYQVDYYHVHSHQLLRLYMKNIVYVDRICFRQLTINWHNTRN